MTVTSTVPAVVDWLVTNITALPACASPVRVFDGWPDTEVATMVIVGGAVTPADIPTDTVVQTVGQPQAELESYTVPVEIHASTGSTNQKTVRDAAYTIRDAIHNLIRADPTLGGLIPLSSVRVTASTLQQTGPEEAAEGRIALLTVTVHVTHWLG